VSDKRLVEQVLFVGHYNEQTDEENHYEDGWMI